MSITTLSRFFLCIAAVVLFNSCNAIWVVPVGFTAIAQSGDRDVSRNKKYWKGITRNATYKLQNSIVYAPSEDQGPYEGLLHASSNRLSHGKVCLSQGTLLQPVKVHYRSDGLNYFWRDYIGIIKSGELKGKTVRLNNILLLDENGKTMSVNSRYLRLAE